MESAWPQLTVFPKQGTKNPERLQVYTSRHRPAGERRGGLSPCSRLSRFRLPLNDSPGLGAGRASDAGGADHARPCLRCSRSLPCISLLRDTLCPKYLQSPGPTSVSAVSVGGILEVSGRQRYPEASSTLTPHWDYDSFSLTV